MNRELRADGAHPLVHDLRDPPQVFRVAVRRAEAVNLVEDVDPDRA
jgi:hypothetical protein